MVHICCQQDVTVVELRSRYDSLDLKVLDEFGETLIAAVERATPPLLLLDLSGTDYIGSSFIEQLLRAWKEIEARQGRMVLCGANPFCLEVLQTTRLDTLWPVFGTRDEAIEDLAKPL